MKNNKSNFNNEEDAILKYLIINLINQGVTFNELIEPTNKIENKKDREEMQNKVTNIILDFINLNPEYVYLNFQH